MLLRRLRLTLFFATLFIITLSAVSQGAEKGPLRTTLPNGLTVIIEEERTAPVVAIQMWVRVGSADETEREAGISHVFEHMLFKGTARRKVGELASAVESVGGDINAYTSFDNTVYHLSIPSRHFSTGLDVIADAVQHSSFDPGELAKELEVVLEEIRMNEDNPGRTLFKSLLSSAYAVHPYKRPVIGYTETVKKFKRDDIIRFFRKWYVPENMTLVIAGDVDSSDALKAVRKMFPGAKKAKAKRKARPIEPAQKLLRLDVSSKPIKEAHFGVAFHIPGLKDEDTYAIDVLASMLGAGETSRLYKNLKIEKELVHGISAYAMSLKEPGLFFVTGTLETRNLDSALKETILEIRRLAYGKIEFSEIERARVNLESDFVYSRETMQGIAGKLGYYETVAGDIGYEDKYIEGIRKVTAEDVRRVVEKYFTETNMTFAAVVPEADRDAVTPGSAASLIGSAFAEAATESKTLTAAATKAEEKIRRVKLDNGMTIVVKEVHANPTVAFYAAFPGGLRFETPTDNGIGSFTADMLTRGTKNRSREDLSKEMEGMAGGVGGFSGWNSMGASGKFLSRHFDDGLEILADIIMNPVFPEDEIEKLRKDRLAAIKSQEDYLPGHTFKLMYRALYKDHPYGMPVIGTPETVTGITRDALIANYERFFVPGRMVLTIVGDVDIDYAVERVKYRFRGFNRTAEALPSPPVETRQTEVRSTGEAKEKAQTHIAIAFLGASIGEEDSYPLKVLSEVLSGQGGRLFVNLRDKRSLAYSLSAFSKEGVDPGIFAVYIATAPGKKDEATTAILDELRAVTTARVTDDELTRAKNSIIGGYEIGLQDVGAQASTIANNELYGLGFDFDRKFPEKISSVTADDILNAARKYLTLDAYTISTVGPNGPSTGK